MNWGCTYLKHFSQPEETVTKLMDQVIFKGRVSCSCFLADLKQPPALLITYPQPKTLQKNGAIGNIGNDFAVENKFGNSGCDDMVNKICK